jgi:hypothetical protein
MDALLVRMALQEQRIRQQLLAYQAKPLPELPEHWWDRPVRRQVTTDRPSQRGPYQRRVSEA